MINTRGGNDRLTLLPVLSEEGATALPDSTFYPESVGEPPEAGTQE